jgi:hypothetical protein
MSRDGRRSEERPSIKPPERPATRPAEPKPPERPRFGFNRPSERPSTERPSARPEPPMPPERPSAERRPEPPRFGPGRGPGGFGRPGTPPERPSTQPAARPSGDDRNAAILKKLDLLQQQLDEIRRDLRR